MKDTDRRSALAFGMAAALISSGSAAAAPQDEVRAVFESFVAAQNGHDPAAVERLLRTSPDFLWITRGTAVWGREAAMERFRALYRGTWQLEPEMAQFRAIALSDGAMQIFVPVLFTIGPSGQPSSQSHFLMNLTLVRDADAWRIASILPIPAPMP
jgi:uncharacterized protein (TIGR02246 family)